MKKKLSCSSNKIGLHPLSSTVNLPWNQQSCSAEEFPRNAGIKAVPGSVSKEMLCMVLRAPGAFQDSNTEGERICLDQWLPFTP